jgi:hypothetical protein
MSQPIWIEAETSGEAAQLVESLTRHGIHGVAVTAGERFYVRIPSTRERTPELLRDVSVALEHARRRPPASPESGPASAGGQPLRLSTSLGRELKRLAASPVHEVERLEREAAAGESPATPAILIAGIALSLWTLVLLVVLMAVVLAHLLV